MRRSLLGPPLWSSNIYAPGTVSEPKVAVDMRGGCDAERIAPSEATAAVGANDGGLRENQILASY
jgi:hypothetical protein